MMLIYGKVSYVAMAPHRKPWQSLKNDMHESDLYYFKHCAKSSCYNQLAFTAITSLNLSPCCSSQRMLA